MHDNETAKHGWGQEYSEATLVASSANSALYEYQTLGIPERTGFLLSDLVTFSENEPACLSVSGRASCRSPVTLRFSHQNILLSLYASAGVRLVQLGWQHRPLLKFPRRRQKVPDNV